MNGFLSILDEYKPFLDLKECLEKNNKEIISITGLSDGSKAHIIANLVDKSNKPAFYICKNQKEAEKVESFVRFYGINAYTLPERDFCYYEIDAKSNEYFKERVLFLNAISRGEAALFIVTPKAFITPLVRKDLLINSNFSISLGEQLKQKDFIYRLRDYVREDVVEAQGQFSVRGGIVDIFPYTQNLPYRIEFFGDEIDSIRTFDPITKLSYETISEANISSNEEYIISNKKILIEKLEKEQKKSVAPLSEIIARDIERLKEEKALSSYDRYFPIFKDYLSNITDYISDNFMYFIDDPKNIYENINSIYNEQIEYLFDLVEKNIILKSNIAFFENPLKLFDKIYETTVVHISFIKNTFGKKRPNIEINIPTKSVLSASGSIGIFVEEIKEYLENDYCIIIPGKSPSKAEKLADTLSNYDISAAIVNDFSEMKKGIQILPILGFSEGFSYPDLKFVYFSDIYTVDKKKKISKPIKNENAITNFADLSVGDNVVHPTHGIGLYLGITRLEVEGEAKDFLKIKYFGNDYLYMPINQLNNLFKYIGNDSKSIKLNKLGGVDFDKVKQRVKKSCQDLAVKLIEIYKNRETAIGYQFSADTDMQIQFERTFPYEETDDQLSSIYEVKKDMELPKPMDRLLCGDVGYGKTEVALRAAFKAVADGKQVAYLAPTTVLAQQHYNTFVSRMKAFPVGISLLSRFRTKKQIDKTLRDTKKGLCDIVIGTHRILSNDVEFKDLGLLIVDEEQRFGVMHKEKIKEMRNGVDILTLSATPIPRTLNMAMIGIRDVSTLKDPPSDRHPVRTFVLEYNENIVIEAINKELNRNGQVFYLYNRVDSIYSVSEKIKKIIPNARIAVAHGRLSKEKMETIFYQMTLGEIDILICTTIIETGLDIPNVNTIIIENADQFGLSQLYQLRGRVGRSNRLAYCYLTYKKDKSISEVSEKRLKAIKEFTEFGSGFKIALRDLEIRGAGNILGAEQHGHMDAVGYDMYIKLLDEAVREKKGESLVTKQICQVDIKISAYIDDKYINDHPTKLEIYKKISLIKDESDVSDIIDELTDRFSEIPIETMNLIDISYIRAISEKLGIYDISENNSVITFKTNEISEEFISNIIKFSDKYKGKILFGAGTKPYFTLKLITENKTKEIKEFLDNIS
jgi:transcription-repair coupling factor (superfamily II helicase)